MKKSKQKSLKISKLKRNNQKRTKLAKQGKLKAQRHRNTKLRQSAGKQNVCKPGGTIENEEGLSGEDLLDMMEEDDLKFIKFAIPEKSNGLLEKIRSSGDVKGKIDGARGDKRKRRLLDEESDALLVENRYEEDILNASMHDSERGVRILLPVKTKEGIVKKYIVDESITNDVGEESIDTNGMNNGIDNRMEREYEIEPSSGIETKNTLSTVELLACRDETLKSRKLKIGLLSSSLLENPHEKINNLKLLLNFINENNPEVCITVKKLTIMSLLEVFKDLLPSYQINCGKEDGVRYKKETLELQNYESALIANYRHYLQRLEKIARKLKRKAGTARDNGQSGVELGKVAVFSMCQLVTAHPYFNYSVNIVNFLIPLLDNWHQEIRQMVFQCFSQIFVSDKRGEISLVIVRKINHYIKQNKHSIHPDIILVLLHLRIKDVNLDAVREEEAKQKKLGNYKQKLLACSKRERKKNKKLEGVEREMLETRAVENRMKKQKNIAEITNIVFTIYFRILKQAPSKQVLSACLEGLAKYSACINLEYYQDLVAVINSLIREDSLGQREQLHCIQTVFTILSGQASSLSLDPHIFHVHFYKQLLRVHAGRNQDNGHIIIEILIQALINRRKRITQSKLIAFVKRTASIALQMQHHFTLGLLAIVKSIMQFDSQAHILLDTDCNSGDGFYQAELEEPEYCNAHCTALWELTALQRHFHRVVQELSKHIACSDSSQADRISALSIGKSSPQELLQNYDPVGEIFKPAMATPKQSRVLKVLRKHNFSSSDFENYVRARRRESSSIDGILNFYEALV